MYLCTNKKDKYYGTLNVQMFHVKQFFAMKNFYIYKHGSFKFFKGESLLYTTDPTLFCSLAPCRLFSGMSAYLFSRRISTKYSSTYSLISVSKISKSSFYQKFEVAVSASEFLCAHPSTLSSAFERSLLVANSVASEVRFELVGVPSHFDVAYVVYNSSSRCYYVDLYYKVVESKSK